MSLAFLLRRRRAGLVSIAVAGIFATIAPGAGSDARAADGAWPTHVTASYKINFSGFDIGHFTYTSSIAGPAGGDYRLDGNAQLSAMLGAFKWQGVSQATGGVAGHEPAPSNYRFDYSSSAKEGSVRMGFRGGNVNSVAASPPAAPNEDLVPLERRHLTDVLDPLTAVMSLTRAGVGQPCQQRLPIFDGKQRFDLVLQPKGERVLNERRPTGQPGMVHVCDVRYVPIAGYKRNSEAEEAARRMAIEMTLRPIPSANLLVPHEVVIPAVVGTVVLSLDRIDIRTSDRNQIALVN